MIKVCYAGLVDVKGVTRYAQDGREIYIVARWCEHRHAARITSLDRQILVHRRQTSHECTGGVVPAAFAYIREGMGNSSLVMHLPEPEGRVTAYRCVMLIHVDSQTTVVEMPNGGVKMVNEGAVCCLSQDLGLDEGPDGKTFDVVYFHEKTDFKYILNGDDAIIVVTDVLREEGKRPVLVIDHMKKVTGMDVVAVRSAAKEVFRTLWEKPDLHAQLKPEELTDPECAKRTQRLMQTLASPMCKRAKKNDSGA